MAHISRVDLNLFVVLEAIYSEGNITRASQKLNLTQPAVSHALARLRDSLNDPLFIRQGTQMLPTPFTRHLISPVQHALQTLSQSISEQPSFEPHSSQRRFCIALRDVLEASVLPPLLQHLQQHAPLIEIASVRVDRHDLETELTTGTLDLALDVPYAVSDKIEHSPLTHDQLVVVSRQHHPAISSPLSVESYLQQQHILVSSRRKGWALEDVELNRMGLKRHITLRCQHYFAACKVVSETDLLLTMPEHYARLANHQFNNQIWPFPLTSPKLDMHLYWHKSAQKDPAHQWLRHLIIKLTQTST